MTGVARARRAQHIAVVMHDFPLGGTERIMIRLANAWAERGRSVTILCGTDAGPARERVAPGVTVRCAEPAIPRAALSRWRLGHAVTAMLPSIHADILVAPGNFHLPVIAAMGRVAIPIVCKLSNALETRRRGPLARAIFRRSVRRTVGRLDALVAMSPALRDEAERFLGHAGVRIARQPVLVAGPAPAPPVPRIAGKPIRILCAGRLVPQKRFDLALWTMAVLGEDAHLTIAGSGPEQARLTALAQALGVSRRIHFTGGVADIAPLLAESDVMLLTSAFEGYPSVLVEAIAAGVPVVTTASSPAIPEIVRHPGFGAIVEPEPRALASAVHRIAAAPPIDRDALAAFVEDHRADRAAADWLALLDETVVSRVAMR